MTPRCIVLMGLLIVPSFVLASSPFLTATAAYNQGTTWVAQGKIGDGIWALSQAQRLSPRDDDIRANLAAAESRISRPIPVSLPVVDAGLSAIRWVRVTEWLAFWTMATTALTLALVYRLRGRMVPTQLMRGLIVAWVGVGVPALVAVWDAGLDRVVIVKTIPVKTAPDHTGIQIQMAPEGTVARVLQRDLHAVMVQLSDGSQGWIRETDVKPL